MLLAHGIGCDSRPESPSFRPLRTRKTLIKDTSSFGFGSNVYFYNQFGNLIGTDPSSGRASNAIVVINPSGPYNSTAFGVQVRDYTNGGGSYNANGGSDCTVVPA